MNQKKDFPALSQKRSKILNNDIRYCPRSKDRPPFICECRNLILKELPSRLDFVFRTRVQLYPQGYTTPSIMEGMGDVIFLFKPTSKPEIVTVSLKKLKVQITPFILPINIDKDDRFKAAIQIERLTADESIFDLNESKGYLDLRTGDFNFDFEYLITPEKNPEFKRFGIFGKWTVHDFGYLDLNKGNFEIHCNPFEIKTGPLKGIEITGGASGEIRSYMFLSAVIKSQAFIADDLLICQTRSTTDTLYICPDDEIILCWKTKDQGDENYILSTPKGDVSVSGNGPYIDKPPYVPGVQQYIYTIQGKDRDYIKTVFADGTWTEVFSAKADGYWKWELYISPGLISDKAKVTEIEFIRSTKDHSCADRNDFKIYHYLDPSKTKTDYKGQSDDWNFAVKEPFYAVGWWEFRPGDNTSPRPRDTKYMCFKLKLICSQEHAPLPPDPIGV
jgi:hypothetical protein